MNRPIHGGNLAWASVLAGCPPDAILDFSASINPLGPPKSAIAAIQRGLGALSAYPDPNYSQLRSALAQNHNLAPEWILPGNGSAELLTWACWELSQCGETYLITPAFGDYERALGTFEAMVIRCPLPLLAGDSAVNPPLPTPLALLGESPRGRLDMVREPRRPSTPRRPWLPLLRGENGGLPLSQGEKKGLLLNNPHNPTGVLWSIEAILPCLDEFDLIVVDEAFMDFVPSAEQQSLIGVVEKYKNLVVLRSLTKFYSLPGLRLGYAIAHPDRLKRWQGWRDPWPVNVLAAAAGVAAIQDTAFAAQTWDWLTPTKAELYHELLSVEGLFPWLGAANFLLLRSEGSSSQLQERLLKQHRILIRDCLSFPELGDRYFRIAIRTPADNQRLLAGLRQDGNDEEPRTKNKGQNAC